ncbi:hypothetical protein G6F46_003530 [Rhizopus delemar]|uniref:Uncharacterized protein n=2 Tax=Rhizopus TaxID=4842 RepID=A0A9P7CMB0_9FUNG|nr:hypothetical protein G6F55_002369 [Rhizopus delemar]KAG1548306.1 hypothetical protein G6F51_003736 [Rhizopus arrhizus]KAG1502718.1 hypothetical protein G6F54_002162 [Rhizopus delemar]KAG1515083.1 hypothetical protein G6F53_003194 [Rhizopus delemar]KAG1527745.1 hypothetical protein G6F52_001270 [Rhizopus delemar]
MSNNPNQDEFQNLENMMNSMMQGAFSLLFRDLSGQIFEPTIANNNQINSIDNYEGSDFRRLVKKSKENRRAEDVVKEERTMIDSTQTPPTNAITNVFTSTLSNTVGSIFNRLFRFPETTANELQLDNNLGNRQNGIQWNYSSTRSTTSPDGTQITITTRKSNGISETVKRVQHPNGQVEETKEVTHG